MAAFPRFRRPSGTRPPRGGGDPDGVPDRDAGAFSGWFGSLVPVSRRQISVMMRQLAVMVGAGLPLAESLSVLHRQQDNRRLRGAVRAVARDVESGSSLAQAMSRHPGIFERLAVAMTAIGEAGGRLDRSLTRLADELEKAARIAAEVRAAFAYPAVVGAIGALVVSVILWRVVPVFTDLYEGLDAELPLATRMVVDASESFGSWAVAALIVFAAGAAAFRRVRRTEAGGALSDRLVLSLPLFGRLVHRAAISRFCRTLAVLTAAGVPVLEGLDIARRAVGNRWLEQALGQVRAQVEAGASLSGPLGQSGLFPAMVVQMVGVGERTGELDSSLEKVADFYEEEVKRATATILPLLEPLLILVLGGVIAGIVVAMYLPIWTLVGRLS